MSKTKFRKGDVFGKWRLLKHIGKGGNGEVWEVNNSTNSSKTFAIKILIGRKPKSYARFKDEVKVLSENTDIKGLLPILDHSLPDYGKGESLWYVMPLAIPLLKHLEGKTPEVKIDAIIAVSETLKELHERKISHRDIKPENILVKNKGYYLSDFGLVDYEGKKNLTNDEKKVGAIWTIAPEMRRDPEKADGKLADIYSLAKTLWILLTGVSKGFDGQYSEHPDVNLKSFVPSIYLGTLHDLLSKGTDPNPLSRPSINEFSRVLKEWKPLNKNFEKRSRAEWKDIQKRLFVENSPKTVIWERIDDIIMVLNTIGEYKQANHTMLPGGGGLDFEGAKFSCEEGCIELDFDFGVYIVKSKRLIYEAFDGHSDWNYFRLDVEGLELIGEYDSERNDEGFTEIEPCVYSDYNCYKYDDFNGKRLPDTARQIVRIKQGAFMICLRVGYYMQDDSTYDGRHNKINAVKFRAPHSRSKCNSGDLGWGFIAQAFPGSVVTNPAGK